MPAGAREIRDYPFRIVRVRCEKCGRSGQYWQERLEADHGPRTGLPDLLRALANCPRWRGASDPCGAHYPDLR